MKPAEFIEDVNRRLAARKQPELTKHQEHVIKTRIGRILLLARTPIGPRPEPLTKPEKQYDHTH